MSQPVDAIADITLLPADRGGRKTPTPAGHFSCPVLVDGKGFDVRFDLDKRRLEPGRNATVSMRFLSWAEARHLFEVGTTFDLWEGRTIGHGVIRSIPSNDGHPAHRRIAVAGE